MNKDITNYSFEQLVRTALSFAIEKCRDIAPQDEPLLKSIEKVSNSALRVLPENFVELFVINRAIEIFLSFASSYQSQSDLFHSDENERQFQTEKIRRLREIQQQVVQKLGNYDACAEDLTNYLYPPATPISSQPPQKTDLNELVDKILPHVLSSQPAAPPQMIDLSSQPAAPPQMTDLNELVDKILPQVRKEYPAAKTQTQDKRSRIFTFSDGTRTCHSNSVSYYIAQSLATYGDLETLTLKKFTNLEKRIKRRIGEA